MSRREARQNSDATTATSAKPGSVEDAKATLAAMKAAKDGLVTDLGEIAEKRKSLAGAALIDKNPDAAKKLEALSAETARITVDLQNMDAAIAAADARLRDAEKLAATLRERENAHAAVLLMEERARLVMDAQRSLDDYARIMSHVIQRGRELRGLTDRAPSAGHDSLILRANMQNSRCQLYRLGLISMEPLPREELRVSLPDMLAHIDAGALAWARKVTAGDDDKGAAA